MDPQLRTAKNGLSVITVDTKSFPTITTLVLVGAGSRYEDTKNNGIAHFFEHMAFKGSSRYPSSFVMSSTIEGIGGVFNAFTSKDHTGYWVKAPAVHFPKVLDVLSDMIQHPLLAPNEIEREKGVIVEEINMYEDTPARKVADLFDEVLFPGHPLGYDIAGTPETVRSFDKSTFTSYISRHYHPGNAVVVVAGGLNGKNHEYVSQIEKAFSTWNGSEKIQFSPFSDTQNKPVVKVKTKKTEQAHFCLGFKTFGFSDTRRYALSLLGAILGGGMSSRLFIEVRERRGLCYYISTGRELLADTGYIVTQAGVTNNAAKLNEALSVTLAEHKGVSSGKVTQDELDRAREMVKGRLLLSLEDSYDVASFVGVRHLVEGKIMRPEEVIAKLDSVQLEDVIDLAREVFTPEKMNVTAIGPFDTKDIKLDI